MANGFYFGLPHAGEKVVDIRSRAGMEAVIAARAVGMTGRVVGVGMTTVILERARKTADALGLAISRFGKAWRRIFPSPMDGQTW